MSAGANPGQPATPERLDSWKEIAAYLRRDIRTVQRWEKDEGLPVHRHLHKKGGSVYAHPAELDTWWASRRIHLAEDEIPKPLSPLKWRWAAMAMLLVAVAALGLWVFRGGPQAPGKPVTVLAVLPFENLSGDAEQDFLSDGLTDEMIVRLGKMGVRDLRVLGRGSAMAFRGSSKPAAAIGNELGADYLLRGSVRRSGERLRVVAQLIRVADESAVWSNSYDRSLRDIVLVQEEVAAAIAEGIESNIAPAGQRVKPARAVDPTTYEAYLKGKYFWNKFSWAHMGTAIGYFKQAIARDPEFAEAHAGLAAAYGIYGNFNMEPPRDVYPLARAAAERALALDDRLPEAHIQMAFHHLFYTRDWEESEREFRRALELAPQSAPAHEGYSMYLVVTGQMDAAQREILRARELDPLSLFVNVDVGWVYYFGRDYDRALSYLLDAQRLDPNFPPTYWVLRQAYAVKGMEAESTQALRKMMVSAAGGATPELDRMVEILQKQGVVAAKQAWLEMIQRRASKGYADAYEMAVVNLRAGKTRPALDWLERGFDDRNFRMAFIQVDPLLDPLRTEPRFQELVRKMKFPPVGDFPDRVRPMNTAP